MSDKTLDNLRKRIDKIDEQIQALICQRASAAREVGLVKEVQQDTQFYRPDREALILKKIMQRDCGLLDPKEMSMIFRGIMSACLALQKQMNIAFLGPIGTYSYIAASQYFGHGIALNEMMTITDVFKGVETKQSNYGVVPIENSIAGTVDETLNNFIQTNLTICGEINLPIKHALLKNQNDESVIKKIYAHQQTLLQCANWLKRNYSDVEQIAVSSNAQAAKLVKDQSGTAVIASTLCGDIYDLEVVIENIADKQNNITRFLVIGDYVTKSTGNDRTTLLITTNDKSGTLIKMLTPFAEENINMTMIKSKPSPDYDNSYIFFIDVDAHQEDESFKVVLQKLYDMSFIIKILGSYPKG
jgi:chorismate mutase/prephenate dehydratase